MKITKFFRKIIHGKITKEEEIAILGSDYVLFICSHVKMINSLKRDKQDVETNGLSSSNKKLEKIQRTLLAHSLMIENMLKLDAIMSSVYWKDLLDLQKKYDIQMSMSDCIQFALEHPKDCLDTYTYQNQYDKFLDVYKDIDASIIDIFNTGISQYFNKYLLEVYERDSEHGVVKDIDWTRESIQQFSDELNLYLCEQLGYPDANYFQNLQEQGYI